MTAVLPRPARDDECEHLAHEVLVGTTAKLIGGITVLYRDLSERPIRASGMGRVPDYRDSGDDVGRAIAGDLTIATDQLEPFVAGLGDQRPVEGIVVNRREAGDGQGVGDGDGQGQETIGGHHGLQIVGSVELAEGLLDGDLPSDGGADVDGVLRPELWLGGPWRSWVNAEGLSRAYHLAGERQAILSVPRSEPRETAAGQSPQRSLPWVVP